MALFNWLDVVGLVLVCSGIVFGTLLIQRALRDLARRDAARSAAKEAQADDAVLKVTAEAEARLAQGRAAFLEFVYAWDENWGAVGAPQPDRVALMTATLATRGKVMLAFIDHCGDLRAAMREAFPNRDVAFTDALAGNIVQVASALSIDALANRIKYTQKDAIREKS